MLGEINQFKDADGLSATLADEIAYRVATAGTQSVSLAVSGGSTPVPLFRELARRKLDWRPVTLTLVDERWAPEQDPMSNAGALKRHWLDRTDSGPHFVGLYHPSASAWDGLDQVRAQAQAVPRPFEAVIFGMGEDGHTASWFPGAANLDALLSTTNRQSIEATEPPGQLPRITWTLAALATARWAVLYIAGERKWRTFERAQRDSDSADMPVRALLCHPSLQIDVYYSPQPEY